MTREQPENAYRDADPADRRRIQTAVIVACRPHVAQLVRKTVAAKHWREAEQVGAIGVLVALEKYDPDRGVPFWALASLWVRKEIQRWINHGVHWRPSSNKGASHAERTGDAGERLLRQRHMKALDEKTPLRSAQASIDDLVIDAQARARLDVFLASLDEDDRQLLLCEKRDRVEGGVAAANNARGRRYLSLIERARAFVMGDDDGSDMPVRGDR